MTNTVINNNIFQTPDIEFRSYDGSGNNLNNPNYGAVGTALVNKAPLDYGDGYASPAGADRVNPRIISNTIAQQNQNIDSDRGLTNTIWAFGQFLDHDLSLVPDRDVLANILVPTGDTFLDPLGTGTVEIVMNESEFISGTGTDPSNPRQLPTGITSWIDGSNIYGSDAERANFLRTGQGGKLKVSSGNLLPLNDGTQANDNPRDLDPTSLFLAGDVRANENSVLASMHTLFIREHNRIARELAVAHPDWTDEQIYQRARDINIAQYQSIIYNEYLPSLLGLDALPEYNGYDAEIDPSITRAFATAAFRFGHSQLSSEIPRLDPQGNEIPEGSLTLADIFFQSAAVVQETGIDPILRGVASSLSQNIDTQTIDDVRNLLFGFGANPTGRDIFAININRGRLNGLADYNTIRQAYGLNKVNSFAEITSDAQLQTELANLYDTVDNIDAFVGLIAEDHVPSAAVGETIRAILVHQFVALRDGDRFYYENTFSPEEIAIIEQTTLSDIIRRNTNTTIIQDNAFSLLNEGTMASEILNGGLGQDTIYGNDGNDEIEGNGANDLLFGNLGNDTLLGGKGEDTLNGGNDNDLLRGQDGKDFLYGNLGADILYGGDGNDLLQGNLGNDSLMGNVGEDSLFGGEGEDTLEGGDDNDLLQGQEGNDLLFGNAGADNIFGDNGFDILYGGNGNDQIRGNNGNDSLEGQGDNDTLYGDDGLDTLFGNQGDDVLFGGRGNDELRGNKDNDTLDGGLGFDTLIGGEGSDHFILRQQSGRDQIQDYQDGLDKFILTGGLTFNDLKLIQGINNISIRTKGTNELLALMNNVGVNSLDADDFIVSLSQDSTETVTVDDDSTEDDTPTREAVASDTAGENYTATNDTLEISPVIDDDQLVNISMGGTNNAIDGMAYDTNPANNNNISTTLRDDLLNLGIEAAFDNLVGFYKIVDMNGGIDTDGDGFDDLMPGDSGYARAAIVNRITNWELRAGSSGDPSKNTTTEQFGDVIITGGEMYAPFVIANAGKIGFEGFVAAEDRETDGEFNEAANNVYDMVAYFAFIGANPDGAVHLEARGNNTFGFEDLPANLGVSDNDFDDAIFSFNFK